MFYEWEELCLLAREKNWPEPDMAIRPTDKGGFRAEIGVFGMRFFSDAHGDYKTEQRALDSALCAVSVFVNGTGVRTLLLQGIWFVDDSFWPTDPRDYVTSPVARLHVFSTALPTIERDYFSCIHTANPVFTLLWYAFKFLFLYGRAPRVTDTPIHLVSNHPFVYQDLRSSFRRMGFKQVYTHTEQAGWLKARRVTRYTTQPVDIRKVGASIVGLGV